ncbi:hypothetical protein DGG96_08440 [Legionella qingyii]|uniref:Uncharacterized protein n=1 Tax=Legionella qingyii TaxID=2184757 RepID=A0A317U371_9GAMM|nr:hypothetical protein DGG96_08440 [Legionella qingyii]
MSAERIYATQGPLNKICENFLLLSGALLEQRNFPVHYGSTHAATILTVLTDQNFTMTLDLTVVVRVTAVVMLYRSNRDDVHSLGKTANGRVLGRELHVKHMKASTLTFTFDYTRRHEIYPDFAIKMD